MFRSTGLRLSSCTTTGSDNATEKFKELTVLVCDALLSDRLDLDEAWDDPLLAFESDLLVFEI
jgi:hypothetical protein